MRRLGLIPFFLAALLFGATTAQAATVTDRPPLFSFDGSDTSAGAFGQVIDIAFDQASGTVYVIDAGKGVLDRFNAEGEAQAFAATGKSSLGPPEQEPVLDSGSAIAVDDLGPNQGRIFVSGKGGRANAYSPAGEHVWGLTPGTFVNPCGLAVDAQGDLWVGDWYWHKKVREFAATGSPPAEILSFKPLGDPCRLAFDTAGHLFLSEEVNFQFRVARYSGASFESTLDPGPATAVALDRSSPTGHIFTLHPESFNEYDAAGALIGSFAPNRVRATRGIAYDPALDRVYVAEYPGKVTAYGPPLTATVPDTTIEASGGVGIAKATFNAKANPLGVAGSYRFEWKEGTGASWERMSASPWQALPGDSSEHALAFSTNALRGNTTYQVRLVTENTGNALRAYSAADTFTTKTAPSSPALVIDSPSAIAATTAHLSATIDPKGDTADWWVQLSTDPACATGFSSQAQQSIAEGTEASLPVSYELSGLRPAQHYCVRIEATNSAGTTISETKEFDTETAIPSQVFSAFAAPRLDTSVRLNGRVNPEGETLSYRFQWSKDGGKTWISLPERKETSKAREQIVLGEELGGLSPNTAYRFRFSAENAAGEASPQGEAVTFTTRSSAEVAAPARGIELINNPDKGNQNVISEIGTEASMSANGERAIWSVRGGAPGGTAGTASTFLAQRGPSGWHSHSLLPPPSGQIGEATLAYGIEKGNPAFDRFLFNVGIEPISSNPGKTLVRSDGEANHQTLATYAQAVKGAGAEITTDGAHVLVIDPDNLQLEDIGDPASPELISVMPDGQPSGCGLLPGLSFAGSGPRAVGPNWNPGYRLMDQGDASRVYFEAAPNGSCGEPYGLYERNRETEATTLIDDGSLGRDVEFIRATPDGRQAYFLSPSRLDPADQNADADVYRFDEASEESHCLTCVVADASIISFGGVLVSDDFSHVYFKSQGQLIPGLGSKSAANTYVLSGGELGFVGAQGVGQLGSSAGNPEAILSADGEALLFIGQAVGPNPLSAERLPATCSSPPALGATPQPCRELYRYDDRDGSIECLSCRQEGETTFRFGSSYVHRNSDFKMSRDGQTVAFVTMQALGPKDVNQAVDAYEWRHGALHLVTDGVRGFQEGYSSPQVRAVSAEGTSILFSVAAPGLTGFEQDGLANLYMARIGGGFEAPSEPAPCSEDACQGPLAPPPPSRQSPSAAFSGRGNLTPGRARRCTRHATHRNRRCASRHRQRSHQRRRGHVRSRHGGRK